jgi:hypothetical protein
VPNWNMCVCVDDEDELESRDSRSSYTRGSSEQQPERTTVTATTSSARRETDASSSSAWWDELQDLRQRIGNLELGRPASRTGGGTGSSVTSGVSGGGGGGDARSSSVRRHDSPQPGKSGGGALDRDRTLRGLAAVSAGSSRPGTAGGGDLDDSERPWTATSGSVRSLGVGGGCAGEYLPASVRRNRSLLDGGGGGGGGGSASSASPRAGSSAVNRLVSPTQQGSSSPAPSAPHGTEHQRLLIDTFDRFNQQLSSSGGGSEGASELIRRMSMLVTATGNLNLGLRNLVSTTVDAQVAAELEEGAAAPPSLLPRVEKAASKLLRASDDQCRSLTEGLMAFTRLEKERERAGGMVNVKHDTPASAGRIRSTYSPRLPHPGSTLAAEDVAAGGSVGRSGTARAPLSSAAGGGMRDSPTLRSGQALSSRAGAALQFQQHEPSPSPSTHLVGIGVDLGGGTDRGQRSPLLPEPPPPPALGPVPRRSKSSVWDFSFLSTCLCFFSLTLFLVAPDCIDLFVYHRQGIERPSSDSPFPALAYCLVRARDRKRLSEPLADQGRWGIPVPEDTAGRRRPPPT